MALLTSGNFYTVTFLPTSDPAWAAMSPPPGIPAGLSTYVVNGTSCPIYIVDGGTGTFAFPGGLASGFDDSLLDSASAAYTLGTLPTTEGPMTTYGLSGAGDVVSYDGTTGVLYTYDPGDIATFKAFLP